MHTPDPAERSEVAEINDLVATSPGLGPDGTRMIVRERLTKARNPRFPIDVSSLLGHYTDAPAPRSNSTHISVIYAHVQDHIKRVKEAA